jgi:hypothetical protein
MCMSCGCGEPDNDHGNPDHITRERMDRAARAAGTDIEQAADNIHASARQLTGKAGGPGRSTAGSMGGAHGATDSGSMSSHGGVMGSGSSTGASEGSPQDHGVRS